MSIIAKSISKTFGKTIALDKVDLSIDSGKLVALVGPSGSGKTTLLRILAGLEAPNAGSGQLFFDGKEVSQLSARERKVGMVFQHYALFRHMTVADNIAFGLSIQSKDTRPSKSAIQERVKELLSLIQLDGYGKRLPSELSGGQRQRVALARTLAVDPKILFLDEPFGALDAKVRKDLRKWLRQFHEKIGLTSIFVTHDQEEALELADEVVVMNNARIEQVGSPQEVFDYPTSPFVIEFMGNVNRVQGLGSASAGHLYVRPHDLEICVSENAEGLKAKILHIFSAGSFGRVTVQRDNTGEILEAEVPRSELANLKLTPGQEVKIRFRHIRVFAKNTKGEMELIERDNLAKNIK